MLPISTSNLQGRLQRDAVMHSLHAEGWPFQDCLLAKLMLCIQANSPLPRESAVGRLLEDSRVADLEAHLP